MAEMRVYTGRLIGVLGELWHPLCTIHKDLARRLTALVALGYSAPQVPAILRKSAPLMSSRPGLLEKFRTSLLTFGLFVLAISALLLLVVPPNEDPVTLLTACVAVLFLAIRWIRDTSTGFFSRFWDLPEGVALVVVSTAMGSPFRTIGLFCVGLALHSMHKSRRQVVTTVLVYAAAYFTSAALTSENVASESFSGIVMGQTSILAVLGGVSYLLASFLQQQDKTARVHTILWGAGVELAAATDKGSIYGICLRAAGALLEGTSSFRVYVAIGSAEAMQVSAGHDDASNAVGLEFSSRDFPDQKGHVFCEGQSIEIHQGSALLRESPLRSLLESDSESVFVFPLAIAGEITGALIIAGELELPEGTRVALELLSAQLALALEGVARAEELYSKLSEMRFRSLVQNASDIILVLDDDTVIQYSTPSVERILGFTHQKILGTRFADVVDTDDRARVLNGIAEAVQNMQNPTTTECRLRHSDGSWIVAEIVCSSHFQDPALNGLVMNIRDITQRNALEQRMVRLALHDQLTGLANRTLFLERLEHALVRARRLNENVGVLFIDLDNFKTVNDTLGHAMGDELLKAVAEILGRVVRTMDTAARLGGDEYAVLLECIPDAAIAEEVAGRIVEALREPVKIAGKQVFANATVGVAVSCYGQETAEHLLGDADIAMYLAKSRGKSRYAVYEPSLRSRLLAHLEMEGGLRRAIDNEEFIIRYQPIVSINGGAIVGVEALLRWKHPEFGVLAPGEFIPLAEECGIISEIDRWVAQEACKQVRTWHNLFPSAPPLFVTVNVSSNRLRDPEFVSQTIDALQTSGLNAGNLVLEITENALIQDTEAAVAKLNALKDLGAIVALDDFGTGYSSLSYIQRLPIEIIKISQAFVSGVGSDTCDTALVRAVVTLAQAMSMRTVAEGIETPEQLQFLRQAGCDMGQGYLFGKPLDQVGITSLLHIASLEPGNGKTSGKKSQTNDATLRLIPKKVGRKAKTALKSGV